METKRRHPLKKTINWIAAALLAAFLFGWIFNTPSPRQYPDREPVHLWHMWTGDWKIIIEDICTSFNESQPRYEAIPLSIPQTIADSKFLLAVAGGEPPDCMAEWNQTLPQFAANGLIQPIDRFMSAEEKQLFEKETYPVAKKIAYYKNRPYCMPLALDVRTCYYRLDHLHSAGLLPPSAPHQIQTQDDLKQVQELLPKTFEELCRWGRHLHVFDSKGRMVRMGFIPQRLMMFTSVFGGGFYDHTRQQLTINTEQNLRTLTYLTQQHQTVGYDKMVRFRSSLSSQQGADWPFAVGKRSITIDGQWRVQQLHKFTPDIEYATAPIPPPQQGGKERAGWVSGNFMVIPRGAKNPEGAWELIKFWTGFNNPDRAADFYIRAGWLPATPRIAETDHYQTSINEKPQFRTFVDLLNSPNLEPTPPVPFQLRLFDLITEADEASMRGIMTPAQSLRHLDEQVQDILARQKEQSNER